MLVGKLQFDSVKYSEANLQWMNVSSNPVLSLVMHERKNNEDAFVYTQS